MTAGEVVVRPFTDADASALAAIAVERGHADRESGRDIRYLRHLGTAGSVLVAEREGRVVGWGAVRALPHVTILSDLFVAADALGSGVGQRLLGALWPDPARPRATFASNDPRALPLYARAGLVPSWPLLYLRGAGARLAPVTASARFASASAAASADGAISGLDRDDDYAYWLGERVEGIVVELDGRIVAAGAGHAGDLAHLAAEPDHAGEALAAALRLLDADSGLVCLPGPHPALRPLLEAGYRLVTRDTYMATGPGLIAATDVPSSGLG